MNGDDDEKIETLMETIIINTLTMLKLINFFKIGGIHACEGIFKIKEEKKINKG